MTWLRSVGIVAVASVVWWATSYESEPMKLSEAESEVWQRTGYAEHVCESFDIQRINERGVDSRIASSRVFADALQNTTDYYGNYSNRQAFVYLTAKCST